MLVSGLLLTGYTLHFGLQRQGSGLPDLGTVPPFTLTSHAQRPFGTADLTGKVWVANFIFTRCPTVCPLFTAKMRDVQRRVPPEVQLVSFSVDPEYDTPPRLEAFAAKHRASFVNWAFVTGELAAIKAAVTEGMKVGFGRDPRSQEVTGLFHGTHFVLVDGSGAIRGYYEMNEPGATDRLVRDVARLVR